MSNPCPGQITSKRIKVLRLLGAAELGNPFKARSGPMAGPQTLSESKLAGTPSGAKPEPTLETKEQR